MLTFGEASDRLITHNLQTKFDSIHALFVKFDVDAQPPRSNSSTLIDQAGTAQVKVV